jgi:hypothetical protein
MNIAVIENNKVENIIVCDSIELAEVLTGKECVQYTNSNPANIGLGYVDGVFEQPVITESIEEQ